MKSHARKIRSLLLDPRIAPLVSCEELESDQLAVASYPELQAVPYIQVNKSVTQPNLDGILFHELIHNIGYPHGRNKIEYAYTCTECCFPEKGNALKELACHFCMRPESPLLDMNYVSSLSDLFIGIQRPRFALQRWVDYLERNPRSTTARAHLRAAINKGYPALAAAVEYDEGVARFLEELFEGMDAMLADSSRTYLAVLPHINQIIGISTVPDVQWGLNDFYVELEELGLETSERTSLVFISRGNEGGRCTQRVSQPTTFPRSK